MSIAHTAELYTEMLNNDKFRGLVESGSANAFKGWELTPKEKELLTAEAKITSSKLNPASNKVLNYLIRNQPLGEAVGLALGNAIGRQLGLPVIGPRSLDCDGGCCGWTSRIMFAQEVGG